MTLDIMMKLRRDILSIFAAIALIQLGTIEGTQLELSGWGYLFNIDTRV